MIYVNQNILQFQIDTKIDLTNADIMKILYTKPDGTDGEWTVTLKSNTVMIYNVQDGDIDQAGTWRFQAYVDIDGEVGYSQIIKKKIHNPINA